MPSLPTLPWAQLLHCRSSREPEALQVPQFAMTPVRTCSCPLIWPKNESPRAVRMVGSGAALWASHGAHRNTTLRHRRKGYMGIAARGHTKLVPACETFQEAKTGCPQHAPGQMRILLCLFPLHLHCLGAIWWSLLAGATLALQGHSIDQAANAETHCSLVHRHCKRNPDGGMGTCHAIVLRGWE